MRFAVGKNLFLKYKKYIISLFSLYIDNMALFNTVSFCETLILVIGGLGVAALYIWERRGETQYFLTLYKIITALIVMSRRRYFPSIIFADCDNNAFIRRRWVRNYFTLGSFFFMLLLAKPAPENWRLIFITAWFISHLPRIIFLRVNLSRFFSLAILRINFLYIRPVSVDLSSARRIVFLR